MSLDKCKRGENVHTISIRWYRRESRLHRVVSAELSCKGLLTNPREHRCPLRRPRRCSCSPETSLVPVAEQCPKVRLTQRLTSLPHQYLQMPKESQFAYTTWLTLREHFLTLAAINCPMVCASPHNIHPSPKMTYAQINAGLRPKISLSLP